MFHLQGYEWEKLAAKHELTDDQGLMVVRGYSAGDRSSFEDRSSSDDSDNRSGSGGSNSEGESDNED